MKNFDFDTFPDRKNTCSSKWSELKSEKEIPMSIADMDFRSPDCVVEALKERSQHGMFGYTYVGDDFYQAFCDWEKKIHGSDVKNEEIIPTAGVITGLQWSMQALTGKGGALVMLPAYPPFLSVPKNLEKPLVTMEMKPENGKWNWDKAEFERIAKSGKIDTFILCNPHNPTGRLWSREELCWMLSISRENNIQVFSDEIHGDIILPGEEFVSVLSLPMEIAGDAVVLTAPSKTFNLPGLQTSCAVIRNADSRKRVKDLMAKSHLPGPNLMGITAATAAYRGGEEWLREMISYLKENIDFTEKFLREHLPEITFIRPQATYLLWLDFRKTGWKCDKLSEKLRDGGVFLSAGTNFGKEVGEGFMRLTAACPRSLLKEALERIEKVIKQG